MFDLYVIDAISSFIVMTRLLSVTSQGDKCIRGRHNFLSHHQIVCAIYLISYRSYIIERESEINGKNE